MPPTTMSHFVRALLDRGHAAREVVASDRRSYRLALTTEGLRAHAAAGRAFREADRRFMAALPIDQEEARATLAAIGGAAVTAEAGVGSRLDRRDGLTCARHRAHGPIGWPHPRDRAAGRGPGRLRLGRAVDPDAGRRSLQRPSLRRPPPLRRRRTRRAARHRPRRRRPRRRCHAMRAGAPTSMPCSRFASGCTPIRGTASTARPGSAAADAVKSRIPTLTDDQALVELVRLATMPGWPAATATPGSSRSSRAAAHTSIPSGSGSSATGCSSRTARAPYEDLVGTPHRSDRRPADRRGARARRAAGSARQPVERCSPTRRSTSG